MTGATSASLIVKKYINKRRRNANIRIKSCSVEIYGLYTVMMYCHDEINGYCVLS